MIQPGRNQCRRNAANRVNKPLRAEKSGDIAAPNAAPSVLATMSTFDATRCGTNNCMHSMTRLKPAPNAHTASQ